MNSKIERVDFETFKGMECEWNLLLSKSPSCSLFLHFDWLLLWWENYNEQRYSFHTLTLRAENRELIAIIPLYLNGSTLMFLGTGGAEFDEVCSEYLDVIYDPKHKKNITLEIISIIKQALKKNLTFDLHNYLAGSLINQVIKTFQKEHWCHTQLCGLRYIVPLPKQNSDYLKSLSTSFVKKMNRAKNKFYNKLEGEITKISTENEINLTFETLQRLHNKRWNDKGIQGAFSSARFLNFHQEFSKYRVKKNELQLWVFKADNQPIAALYAFDMFNIRYFYQCGIDDTFKPNLSPGSLMHFAAIEDAINNNLINYDFMKGNLHTSYKSNFSPNLIQMFHTKIINKSFANFFRMIVWKIKHLRRMF